MGADKDRGHGTALDISRAALAYAEKAESSAQRAADDGEFAADRALQLKRDSRLARARVDQRRTGNPQARPD